MILSNDQHDSQFFFVYVYFNFLHVSSIQVLIIRRFNLPIRYLVYVTLTVWYAGLDVPSKPAYRTVKVTYTRYRMYVYFNSLHVSSIQVLIIRRLNCTNTISGTCHSDRPVCRFGRSVQTCIPDGQSDIPDIVCMLISILYMFRAFKCSSS